MAEPAATHVPHRLGLLFLLSSYCAYKSSGPPVQCAHQKSPWGGINIARLIKHKSLNVKTDTFILSRLCLYRFLFNEKGKAYFFTSSKMPVYGVTQLIILFLNVLLLWGCLILFSHEIICCSIIRTLTLVNSTLVMEIIQDEHWKTPVYSSKNGIHWRGAQYVFIAFRISLQLHFLKICHLLGK